MMRILVVDDEEHLRRMMRLTLEATGYEVAEATDGEEALKMFGDGLSFDATLLDQRMPGMDGLETLRRMKLRRADACIIMVTAYATIELAVDAMKVGATDFIRKPMTPDTLRHAVAAALTKRDRPSASTVQGDQQQAPTPPNSAEPLPPVEIWTTNGFFIHRVAREPATNEQGTAEHHFVVRRGNEGVGTQVVVSIDPKAVARIARECKRSLSPAGAFWRRQAESALVNHVWSEADVPEGRRLVVSRVTGVMLDEALSWSKD
jgi:DNA-binding response OmpR family regulator